jgi:hypothetical protein
MEPATADCVFICIPGPLPASSAVEPGTDLDFSWLRGRIKTDYVASPDQVRAGSAAALRAIGFADVRFGFGFGIRLRHPFVAARHPE